MTCSRRRSCSTTELRGLLVALAATSALASGCGAFCETDACQFSDQEWKRIEGLAGLPDPPPDPANKYVGNALAEQLGQMLYFDPYFSGPATGRDSLGRSVGTARVPAGQPVNLSCASCHDPARGGSDYTSVPGHVSVGAGWYDVNSPTTYNSAYYDLKYWNGRYDSLVWQILAVTESGFSMNGNRIAVALRLAKHYRDRYDALFPEYPLPDLPEGVLNGKPGDGECPDPADLARDAFDCLTEDQQKAVTRAYVNYAKAIAAYEYRLISRNSAFDRFVMEGPESEAISPAAKRGARLFVGKAACIDCHSGPLMADQKFHNIGVPQLGAAVPREADCPAGDPRCDCVNGPNCSPWGWYLGVQRLQSNKAFRIDSAEYSDDPSDTSRKKYYELPLADAMKGAWRTPSLREVARTAPYMHNGYYRSLEEVVRHYAQGGTRMGAAPEQLSKRLAPLRLAEDDIHDLVAFLETLNGEPLPLELVTAPALPGP